MADEAGIIRESAIVQDSLLALPDDAFAEKYELRRRQDELREQAARFAVDQDEGRSDAELLSELAGLRSQLAKLDKQKINLVSRAGGGPGESTMGNLGGSGINARHDGGIGRYSYPGDDRRHQRCADGSRSRGSDPGPDGRSPSHQNARLSSQDADC